MALTYFVISKEIVFEYYKKRLMNLIASTCYPNPSFMYLNPIQFFKQSLKHFSSLLYKIWLILFQKPSMIWLLLEKVFKSINFCLSIIYIQGIYLWISIKLMIGNDISSLLLVMILLKNLFLDFQLDQNSFVQYFKSFSLSFTIIFGRFRISSI